MTRQTIFPFADIPSNSDLTAQFTRIKIVEAGTKKDNKYKLVASSEALSARWLQSSPSRKAGKFSFDSITGKDAWEQLFGEANPNSFLTSEGRSMSFETGAFRRNKNGDYVSHIRVTNPPKDIITGSWKNASLFIDSTANTDLNTAVGSFTGTNLLPASCADTFVAPVVITNYTNITQEGSINVNSPLTAQVSLSASPSSSSTDCTFPDFGSAPPAIQENFTVEPGQTIVYYLTMGGQDTNIATTSHNIAIGGLPSGTSNASWYDFYLTLNADLSFEKLTLNYSGTGGTGTGLEYGNGQNGFNATYATASTTTANGVTTTTFQNSTNIWSPYSSGNTNGNWYLPPNSPPDKWEQVIYWNNPPSEVNPIIGLAWIA